MSRAEPAPPPLFASCAFFEPSRISRFRGLCQFTRTRPHPEVPPPSASADLLHSVFVPFRFSSLFSSGFVAAAAAAVVVVAAAVPAAAVADAAVAAVASAVVAIVAAVIIIIAVVLVIIIVIVVVVVAVAAVAVPSRHRCAGSLSLWLPLAKPALRARKRQQL